MYYYVGIEVSRYQGCRIGEAERGELCGEEVINNRESIVEKESVIKLIIK